MTAFFTALRFAGWTAALLPVQMILVRFNLPFAMRLPMIYHRGVCRLLAFRVEQHGEMSRTRPTLFVCNHTSYLDISLLGAVLPASFIAKSEVRSWPLFGLLARLQRTVFVERRAVRTAVYRDEMHRRLEQGDNLILFPEGTSNDGNRVLPFKSALFGVAEKEIGGQPLTVQPVSISYIRLDGIPVGRRYRPYFAWYGDMEMAGHLWNVFGLGQTTVAIEFHQPVTIAQFASRKLLSAHCERVVAEGVSRAIHGRLKKAAKHAWWASKPA
jgi:1-acyl-sn-glycerol-3-phosphate acyltransferase